MNPAVSGTAIMYLCPMCGVALTAEGIALRECEACGAEGIEPREQTRELTSTEVLAYVAPANDMAA